MRVLWFSVTPSLFDEKKYGGWISSLERIISCHEGIELGIAFEYKNDNFKVKKNNVIYYPIDISSSLTARLIEKMNVNYKWNNLRDRLLKIIDDFEPDIIQCFGSEWPFGLIAEYTEIPVVIHMQGFSNIYYESSNIAFSNQEYIRYSRYNPRMILSILSNKKKVKDNLEKELRVMKNARYFLGRTDWDRNIVKHFSPDAKYFYCSEALRPEIYGTKNKWDYCKCIKNSLVTITQAGVLKGNEMILRTAKILKDYFSFDFVWNVAGNPEAFIMAERKTGINHSEYNINLLGMISSDEVERMLRESMVYIHPAIIDNSPNSLCEAQVVGCPVTAANVGGVSSLVKNKETGLLYPYNEPFALAFNIMDLLKDKDRMINMSLNEIKLADKRHNPENIKNDLLNAYRCILNVGEK